MFAPVYETAAAAHPDIVFGKVETEAEQALASVRDLDVETALAEQQRSA